jgi:hypothetical protein
MPNSSPNEWIEIYNKGNMPASIDGWKISDSTTTSKNIPSTTIPVNGYYVFEFSSGYLNNDTDQVKLMDNTGTIVDSTTYNTTSSTYSWSKSSTWCLAVQSKGSSNNSCANITPTPTTTPTPSNTPSPTLTPYPTSTVGPSPTATTTPTRYPTFTPIPTVAPLPTEGPEPTVVIEPTATIAPEVLGDSDQSTIGDIIFPTPTPKTLAISKQIISPTVLAAAFVGIGGVLLLIPIIMIKLRQ